MPLAKFSRPGDAHIIRAGSALREVNAFHQLLTLSSLPLCIPVPSLKFHSISDPPHPRPRINTTTSQTPSHLKMGSNDIPPSHVPSHYLPVSNLLLLFGGTLWTLCYILFTQASLQDRTYGMPLPALSLNIAWEFIFSLYVSETLLEKSVFSIWLLIDLGLVYGMLKYGREEWKDRPWVGRWLGSVFWSATAWCTMGMWAFCRWWIEERVGGGRIGKVYRGVKGEVDTTELGYCELQYCILRVWRGGF